MALSPGGLAGFLLLGILLNLGVVVGAYIWHYMQQKKGLTGIRFDLRDISEKQHGVFRWIIFVMVTFCWVASVFATASCNFLKVTIQQKDVSVTYGFGFVKFFVPEVISNPAKCQGFASDGLGYFQGNHPAFTFAMANCILTSFGLVGIICIQFFLKVKRLRPLLWLLIKIAMYCSIWCCICTFYVQETSVCDIYECSLGQAGVMQVFNVLFLMVVSALLFMTDCGDEAAFDKCRTKTVVVRVPAGSMSTSNQF